MGQVIDINSAVSRSADQRRLEIQDLADQPVVVEFGDKAILFRGNSYLNVLDIDSYSRSMALHIERVSSKGWGGGREPGLLHHALVPESDKMDAENESSDVFVLRGSSGGRPLVEDVTHQAATAVLDRIESHLRGRVADAADFDHVIITKQPRWKQVADPLIVVVCVIAAVFGAAVAAHGGWIAGARLLTAVGITG